MTVKSYKFIVLAFALTAAAATYAEELLDYPLDTINGEEVYRYEVEKSVGLYRIGLKFNVQQNDIIRLNPQLRERGLHYGEMLYVPTGRPVGAKPVAAQTESNEVQVIESAPVVISTTVTESVNNGKPVVVEQTSAAQEAKPVTPAVQDTQNTRNSDGVQVIESAPVVLETTVTEQYVSGDRVITKPAATADTTRRVVELAVMLPFESHQAKRSGNADRMMEFYQGALLALRDLQNDSILYRVRVYDTERSERRVNALCDSTELDRVKGILGLVYPIQIERMADWCDLHQVPLLLPFSDDAGLARHPQLLQFNSTDMQEADSLCTWMKAQADRARFIAVEVREADLAESVRTLRKQMSANGLELNGLPLRDLVNDSAAYALDRTKENIIILHSDRYQHVRILLPHLEKLHSEGFRIRIVSQYSWQKERVSLPQVFTSMFTANRPHEAYDAAWTRFFTAEHVSSAPRYDLLGYDLMRALVDWTNGRTEHDGLQSLIRWHRQGDGGWQNALVKVVTLDN